MSDKDENKKEETKEIELEKLVEERNDYLAGWQRSRADFLNYKKEETERLARTIQFANEDMIKDLIFVMDSFSLVENGLNLSTEGKDQLKPFLMVKAQLENTLKTRGLEKVKISVGDEFSPEVHEAIAMIDDSRASDSHKVIEVIADGYYLNGKLIRPAKVRVSK